MLRSIVAKAHVGRVACLVGHKTPDYQVAYPLNPKTRSPPRRWFCTDDKRLAAIQKIKLQEADNLFNLFARPEGNIKVLYATDLERLLACLGKNPASPEFLEHIDNMHTNYGGKMSMFDFMLHCDQYSTTDNEGVKTAEHELRAAFNVYDSVNICTRDGSGTIDPSELVTMLSTCGGSPLSLEDATNFIRHFDKNSDGEIDFAEFCSLLDEGVISWSFQPAINHHPARFRTGYRVAFVMGGPGSGKGTVSDFLVSKTACGHVSTGDMLVGVDPLFSISISIETVPDYIPDFAFFCVDDNEGWDSLSSHVYRGNRFDCVLQSGKKFQPAFSVMAKGELVSPQIIMKMLRNYLMTQPGRRVLIDGFPRTIQNASDFEALCGKAEFVLWMNASDETLTERLLKRGMTSGRVSREDDNLASIKIRLSNYNAVVQPLIEHFKASGTTIYTVDANQDIEQVLKDVKALPPMLALRHAH